MLKDPKNWWVNLGKLRVTNGDIVNTVRRWILQNDMGDPSGPLKIVQELVPKVVHMSRLVGFRSAFNTREAGHSWISEVEWIRRCGQVNWNSRGVCNCCRNHTFGDFSAKKNSDLQMQMICVGGWWMNDCQMIVKLMRNNISPHILFLFCEWYDFLRMGRCARGLCDAVKISSPGPGDHRPKYLYVDYLGHIATQECRESSNLSM